MHRNAIPYKGTHLAPGSDSHRLHTERKFKELDQHLQRQDENEERLRGSYAAARILDGS